MQHCIPSRVTYLCDKFETKILQLIRKTIQHRSISGETSSESTKLLGPEYNDLLGEYLSIKRLKQSIFNESYSAAAHPCARAFRHNFQISNFTSAFIFTLVQNVEGPNKRYRCWMCQQDLSRSVYYRHMRRNGCSALVRMPTKECHTTKNTNIYVTRKK